MANTPTSQKAVFTEGSSMRHVINMSATGAVGLLAIFLVDVINLFYISLLGEQELAAALGYASTLMFFTISVSIGFSIATTAITAEAIGAGKIEEGRKNAGASVIFMVSMAVVLVAAFYPLLPFFVSLLGARGETHQLTVEFMQVAVVSFPLMSIGMCASALLRARGDARRAMYVTLSAGGAALIIDPLLIIGLGLGIHGAALAILFVRMVLAGVGLYFILHVHNMIAIPDFKWVMRTVKPFFVICIPAVLTQIATPVGNAYVTATIAEFGDDAVAGWAIIGRLIPLAFAAMFSLSGAVGPILSQNLGAKKYDRIHRVMWDSLIFTFVYCVIMWALLAFTWEWIVQLFQADGNAKSMIRFFCLFVAASYIFNGILFVANAAFNNLGFPIYSTVFNWGRATLGIIPFVWVGQQWGAEGVLAGWGLGAVLFGVLAVMVCFREIKKLPDREDHDHEGQVTIPSANSPFTSGKGASAG